MSIWSDIHKRSNGYAERKEDIYKYIKLEKIAEILKSMKVGPDDYPPCYLFGIIVQEFDDSYQRYAIVAEATQHPNGERDFYSEKVMKSFETMINDHKGIVVIDNFYSMIK